MKIRGYRGDGNYISGRTGRNQGKEFPEKLLAVREAFNPV